MAAEVPARLPSFPATQWSLVMRAGHAAEDVKRQALEALLRQYLPALRAHLLISRSAPPDDIDDLLQGFIADKVVERELVARAQREKGRFRAFVAISLDRYAASQSRFRRSTLRSPARGVAAVPLEGAELIDRSPSCFEAFNRAWAEEVISGARGQMRAECEATGRADVWAVFQERVVAPALEGAGPTPYAELAGRLGLNSEAQAANLLVTAKRHFGRALRAVVAEYLGDERLVEEEIEALIGGI
jgi:hypothetical protein